MKLNTKKFIRNIIICLIAFIIVSLILNYAPGFKRDKYKNVTKLIINDEDFTEKLAKNVFIDEDNNIYLSKEDMKNFFDKNIYYSKENNMIITTSNTKVASMLVDNDKVTINGVEQTLKAKALEKDETIYIPLSELSLVYNINTKYIADTNKVVVERLNTGLIKATVAEESVIKFKPRRLSKNVGELKKDEEVSCYYTTSKGWRLIRTEDGTLGYVKANTLTNQYIVRQDLNDEIKTAEITTSLKDGSTLSLYNKETTAKIKIRTLFNISSNGAIESTEEDLNSENYKIWATISNKGLEKQTNELIMDYSKRTELINTIVSYASKYRVAGINIDFERVNNNEAFNRFIIELTPRLRELGITTNVILNNSFDEAGIVGIVDYLITEKGEITNEEN